MNLKLQEIQNKSLLAITKVFSPYLGMKAKSKEKRFSVELRDDFINLCKYNNKTKKVENLIHENFNLEDSNKSIFNEGDYSFYCEKISQILRDENLLGQEVTVIVPTSETIIRTINIPVMDDETLLIQTQDIEFWNTFEELSDDLEDKQLSYQIVSTNEESQEFEVLVCLLENSKVELLHKLFKEAGADATVFEPKCFSIINSILSLKKENNEKEFAFFEYGEKENYLITTTKNKLKFALNNVSKADVVLIKTLETMPDPSGPFWSEVFERSIQDIRGNLTEDEWISEKDNKSAVRDMYVHTDLALSIKYIQGIQTKLPEVKLKKISLNSANENQSIESENFFNSDVIKFDKKIIKKFSEGYDLRNENYYPVIGAALRTLNPFKIKEPKNVKYRFNFYHLRERLINNRKIETINSLMNSLLIVFLIIFTSLTAINIPQYLEKSKLLATHASVVNSYNTLFEEIKRTSVDVKMMEKNKNLAKKINDNKDRYSQLIFETANSVPRGVEIKAIEFTNSEATLYYEGHALTDYDLNVFIENIKTNIGDPDITMLNQSVVSPQTSTTDNNEKVNTLSLRNFKIKVNL